MDNNRGFRRNSIKKANEAKKWIKLQQPKYQHAKHKSSVVIKPTNTLLNKASDVEAVRGYSSRR